MTAVTVTDQQPVQLLPEVEPGTASDPTSARLGSGLAVGGRRAAVGLLATSQLSWWPYARKREEGGSARNDRRQGAHLVASHHVAVVCAMADQRRLNKTCLKLPSDGVLRMPGENLPSPKSCSG